MVWTTSAMNNIRIPHNLIIILLLILITLSVGVHFLHDLQPRHADILGISSGSCNGALHYGIFTGVIPTMFLIALLVKDESASWFFLRTSTLSVFVPPPIR